MNDPTLLEVRQLSVSYPGGDGGICAVREVDLEVRAGECLGVVGESGSGKTQLLWATLGLCGPRAAVTGSVRYRGKELLGRDAAALNQVRGRRIALVSQDPANALNPYMRTGQQIIEGLQAHSRIRRREAERRAVGLLESLHMPDPAQRMRLYPHQLSGGMRQRVAIAMAMITEPELLLVDEPTTALDVTIQAQILFLFAQLRERGTAIVLVTHDLGVVAQLADRIAVMNAGRVVEQAAVHSLFAQPQHPYTKRLLQSVVPATHAESVPLSAQQPLLRVQELAVSYRICARGRHQVLTAVNGVSFDMVPGEALAIVGESGSGKSSLARALLRLVEASRGRVLWRGVDLLSLTGAALRARRRHLQLIFQDPLASLDPRMSIVEIVAEPLRAFESHLTRPQRHARALQALESVGLQREYGQRLPHEFSGGQAQRIAIARALVANPELLVCDEPLSALDVCVKGQISQLLQRLRQEQRLSLLFISHDLPAVHDLCDRVLVLYLGKVMEVASCDAWFAAPRHPYSRALLRAVPPADPVAARARPVPGLMGEIPSPLEAPSGCVFRTRCSMAIERCALETPELRVVGISRVACHRAEVSDLGVMW